jgi:uncharacterized protein (TIGR03067 family)
MKALSTLFTLAIVGIVLASDPCPEPPDPDSDARKILGTWDVEKLELHGAKFELPHKVELSLTFAKGKLTIKNAASEKTGSYKLDTRKKPKAVDITADDKKTVHGIYQLDGDTLLIALGQPGEARPKDFTNVKSSVMTLKRRKK